MHTPSPAPLLLYSKNGSIQEKIFFFIYLIQNIDIGNSLEPPRRGGSNVYPQSMFKIRNHHDPSANLLTGYTYTQADPNTQIPYSFERFGIAWSWFYHVSSHDLTHISLVFILWDIGKQHSPRCDATERGVPSGAILFAWKSFIEKLNKI